MDWTVALGALLEASSVDVRRVDLMAVAVRWASKVEFAAGPDDCWIWTGGRSDSRGYGRMRIGGRHFYAHRVALALAGIVVPPADELEPDHTCLRPPCQRPGHLEFVTHAENVRRHYRAQTTCLRGHPRTDENVYRDELGRVAYCRVCKREKRAAGEWS